MGLCQPPARSVRGGGQAELISTTEHDHERPQDDRPRSARQARADPRRPQRAGEERRDPLRRSHRGLPVEGEYSEENSLKPVAEWLSAKLGQAVPLVADYLDGVAVEPGQVVLLENVRFNKGEKKNLDELTQKYAALCDVFVMDAFGTAHRAEGSTHGVAKFAKVAAAGPLLAAELDALGKALKAPAKPMVAIV